jgi:hypothetical protein
LKKQVVVVLILASSLLATPVHAGIWDPFHSKEEKIDMWMNLWDSSSNTIYESVGKTYLGNDIWMFKAGNSQGGRLLLDGEMHGNEDKGSEILYFMAEWLLTSGDPRAQEILRRNYVMFIPVLNFDSDARGNANYGENEEGVDLNRNFITGWQRTQPVNDIYSGPRVASEPETRVLRDVFEEYRPDFYVNMHAGAGPVAFYSLEGNATVAQDVIEKVMEYGFERGVYPYRTRGLYSQGFAVGDASSFGASAWLIEVEGRSTAWRHTEEIFQDLKDIYFPKCLLLFMAMSEYCAIEEEKLGGDLDGDYDVDLWDALSILESYRKYLVTRTIDPLADLDSDQDVDLFDVIRLLRIYMRFE